MIDLALAWEWWPKQRAKKRITSHLLILPSTRSARVPTPSLPHLLFLPRTLHIWMPMRPYLRSLKSWTCNSLNYQLTLSIHLPWHLRLTRLRHNWIQPLLFNRHRYHHQQLQSLREQRDPQHVWVRPRKRPLKRVLLQWWCSKMIQVRVKIAMMQDSCLLRR